MSVESMTMVTVSGPKDMIDTAIQKLVINRQFHPENAITEMSGVRHLLPFDLANPYSVHLAKADDLAEKMGIKLCYRDFTDCNYSIDEVSAYLDGLNARFEANRGERDIKAAAVQNDAVLSEQLKHFAAFDIELGSLFELRYVKLRFGRIPQDVFDGVASLMNTRTDVYYIESGRAQRWVYGAYCVLPHDYTKVDAIFASYGFERIRINISDEEDAETANEAIERIKQEAQDAEKRIGELDALHREMISQERDKLLAVYSWLKFMGESFDLRCYAGQRHDKFYIVGWIPKSISEEYVQECESYEGVGCILADPKDKKGMSPPVKLKKGLLSSIYEPFVEMYGLPAYGEVDPRLFMAITYTLIFGVMFGDVGQGACLAVIGFLLWKLKGMWLGRMISLCGLSSSVMGFIYGSVFGSEEIIDGFHVLKNGNTMKILLMAVGIGVVLLLLCMLLNIITGIRQKDIRKIFFSPNGVAGFILYAGLAAGLSLKLMRGIDIMTTPYIILVIVVPLLMLVGATPLSKLLTGQKDWKPDSIGMFFVEGFFELFETLLSYVSNTVSFLRIGAYAISHAGMMMVVYMLSAGAGGESLFGLILGNILITGLEAALVSIQVLRLEFYELFGRFYMGGGRKFTPVEIDYKAAV